MNLSAHATTYTDTTINGYNGDWLYTSSTCYMCGNYSSIECSGSSIGGGIGVQRQMKWLNPGDIVRVSASSTPNITISGTTNLYCYRNGGKIAGSFERSASCAAGRYGIGTCYTCPSPGTSIAYQNNLITGCYIPTTTTQTNTKGSYKYAESCYYE